MFDKKDPLIGAVQQVMQKNAEERARIQAVNERFGIQAKRQLPHERHAEYDRAIAEAKSGGTPAVIKEEVVEEAKAPKEYGVDGERSRATKAQKIKLIMKKRMGKGDGKESVEQSRRKDK